MKEKSEMPFIKGRVEIYFSSGAVSAPKNLLDIETALERTYLSERPLLNNK